MRRSCSYLYCATSINELLLCVPSCPYGKKIGNCTVDYPGVFQSVQFVYFHKIAQHREPMATAG